MIPRRCDKKQKGSNHPMALDTDFHSHVSRSSAQRMAQAAQEQGLRVLGLSEHVFQMSEAHSLLEHMGLEGPLLRFDTYIAAVRNAAEEQQLDVRLGLEIDFIPEKNEAIQSFLKGKPWDFLIGSVHEIDGGLFEREHYQGKAEGEARWLRYYQLLRAAVKSGYFDVISHPVRMRSTNPYLPATLDEELEQLAAEATQHDVALEINGYDMLTYPNVVRRLVKACTLHRTPISVGSDAHIPARIAQAHQQTNTLLRVAQIKTVRIWKQRVPEEYVF